MSSKNRIPDQLFAVKVGDTFVESSITHDYGEAITEANEKNGKVITYLREEN